jgi:hypothetical protein
MELGHHVRTLVDGVHDGLDLMAQTFAAVVFTASLLPVAVLAGPQARGVAAVPGRQRAGATAGADSLATETVA